MKPAFQAMRNAAVIVGFVLGWLACEVIFLIASLIIVVIVGRAAFAILATAIRYFFAS